VGANSKEGIHSLRFMILFEYSNIVPVLFFFFFFVMIIALAFGDGILAVSWELTTCSDDIKPH
jgi:hypothetical protein